MSVAYANEGGANPECPPIWVDNETMRLIGVSKSRNEHSTQDMAIGCLLGRARQFVESPSKGGDGFFFVNPDNTINRQISLRKIFSASQQPDIVGAGEPLKLGPTQARDLQIVHAFLKEEKILGENSFPDQAFRCIVRAVDGVEAEVQRGLAFTNFRPSDRRAPHKMRGQDI